MQNSLRKELNDLARDHLAAVISAFCVIMSMAAGFYFSTQVQLVRDVGANTERSESNELIVSDIGESLKSITGDVSDIRVNVAVIKEKVETLEKK